MKKVILSIIAFFAFNSTAQELEIPLKKQCWPFDGIFGKFDRRAAQRGFQVYKQVCATCHGLYHLSYRNLENIGITKPEIRAIAAEYEIEDGPNDEGEMFTRPARPSDRFARPYPNEQAARAANNGAYPVDLSLIIKAREDGANYLYSLLTGYEDPPEGFDLMDGLYYNKYFPGNQIAMPPPLMSGQVEYIDGTEASVHQMAKDLVIFLQWAAEPEMEQRKSMGLKSILYLLVFTVLFYLSKRKIWSKLEK